MMPRKLSHRTSRSSFTFPMKVPQRVAAGAAVVVAALIISSVVNRFIAKRAERNNPPIGKFLDVGPSGLHYLEHGTAKPRPFFEK